MNQISKIIEPSLGQLEYIKSINDKNKAYMSFEANLSDINIEVMERTLSFMVKRHESLRTIFPIIDEQIKQVIISYDKNIFKLHYLELNNEEDYLQTKEDIFKKYDAIISNIGKGPLVKFFLLKKKDSYLFIFLINHIICDAWSLRLIGQELFEIYTSFIADEIPKLVPLKFQLGDYCNHQNTYFNKYRYQLSAFWNDSLRGFNNLLKIEDYYKSYAIRHDKLFEAEIKPKFDTLFELNDILDREETSVFPSMIINEDFYELKELSKFKNYSITSILYTSFYILIFTYARKNKVLLTSLIADRGKFENKYLIGCLLGGTYMPISITEESIIDDLIEEVFSVLLKAVENVIYSHDFLGMDGMELRTSSDMYVNYISVGDELSINEIEKYNNQHQPDEAIFYAMNCLINEYTNGLTIKWRYNKTLFTKRLIEDMVECHQNILNCIIKNNVSTMKDVISFLKLT